MQVTANTPISVLVERAVMGDKDALRKVRELDKAGKKNA